MSDHCDACIWELKDPCPECVETIQYCADQDDSNCFDVDFGEPNPVVVPPGFADYFKGNP